MYPIPHTTCCRKYPPLLPPRSTISYMIVPRLEKLTLHPWIPSSRKELPIRSWRKWWQLAFTALLMGQWEVPIPNSPPTYSCVSNWRGARYFTFVVLFLFLAFNIIALWPLPWPLHLMATYQPPSFTHFIPSFIFLNFRADCVPDGPAMKEFIYPFVWIRGTYFFFFLLLEFGTANFSTICMPVGPTGGNRCSVALYLTKFLDFLNCDETWHFHHFWTHLDSFNRNIQSLKAEKQEQR